MKLKALIEVKEIHNGNNIFGGEVQWGKLNRMYDLKIISSGKLIPPLSSMKLSSLKVLKGEVDNVAVGYPFTGVIDGGIPLDIGDYILAFSSEVKYKKASSN